MNLKKIEIRNMLIDLNPEKDQESNSIDQLCIPILQIINRVVPADNHKLTEAIVCLTHLISDPNLLAVK